MRPGIRSFRNSFEPVHKLAPDGIAACTEVRDGCPAAVCESQDVGVSAFLDLPGQRGAIPFWMLAVAFEYDAFARLKLRHVHAEDKTALVEAEYRLAADLFLYCGVRCPPPSQPGLRGDGSVDFFV